MAWFDEIVQEIPLARCIKRLAHTYSALTIRSIQPSSLIHLEVAEALARA